MVPIIPVLKFLLESYPDVGMIHTISAWGGFVAFIIIGCDACSYICSLLQKKS